MSRLAYLKRKIFDKFGFGPKGHGDDFCQTFGKIDPIKINRIGFYLGNPLLTHLGDQMFFEPAIKLASTCRPTVVYPTPAMRNYFTSLGVNISSDLDVLESDIIVTRRELLPEVLDRAKNVMSFNTVSFAMPDKVCPAIAKTFANLLKLNLPDNYSSTPRLPTKSDCEDGQAYVVVAPFVDSGWFRVTRRDVEKLGNAARDFADKNNLQIAVVGSPSEKNLPLPKTLPENILDWRGMFTPEKFCQIAGNGSIIRVFSFDTFVAHVALAAGIPVSIKMKRSLPAKHKFLVRSIIPPFPPSETTRIEWL